MQKKENTDSPDSPHAPEQRKFGRYVIHDEIGRGGMGVVYKARDPKLDRYVALKVLSSSTTSTEEVARFTREAQAIARLRHPNIVTVHDVGEYLGMRYYAMELLEGESLDRVVKHFKRLPPQLALKILAATADAVEAAHAKGVLHRDIKPANIFLELSENRAGTAPHPKDAKGSVFSHLADMESVRAVLTDFGVARDLSVEAQKLTATGALLGTPHYMSPEQAARDREAVGAQSDVYSLGATLYEAVTGRPPFTGGTLVQLVSKITSGEAPDSPTKLVPHLPRDVETIVMKALAKNRKERYTTAAELRDDMRRFLKGETIHAKPPTTLTQVSMSFKRNKRAVVAAVAFFVVLAAAVTVSVLGTRDSTAPGEDGREGQEEPSQTTFEKAKQDLQAAASLLRAGLVKDGREKASTVIVAIYSVSDKFDDSAQYWLVRARTLELLDKRSEAIQCMGRAIEIAREAPGNGHFPDPGSPEEETRRAPSGEQLQHLLFERGRLQFQLGMDHTICDKATSLFGTAFHSPQGVLDSALEDFAEAEKQQQPLGKAQALYCRAARAFVKSGFKPEDARELAARLLELDARNEAAWLLKAQIDYFVADYLAVLAATERLFDAHRGVAGAYLVRGLAAMWEGELEQSTSAYEKVLELSVEDPIPACYAYLLGWWSGREDKFPREGFGGLGSKYPRSHLPSLLEGTAYLLRPTLRVDWQNVFQYFLPTKAVEQFQKAMDWMEIGGGMGTFESSPDADLALRDSIMRKLSEIEPALKKQYSEDPSISGIPAMLGMASALRRRYDDAIAYFQTAAESSSLCPIALMYEMVLSSTISTAGLSSGEVQYESLFRMAEVFDSCPANLVFTRNLNSRLLKSGPLITVRFEDETVVAAIRRVADMTGLRIEIDPAAAAIVETAKADLALGATDVGIVLNEIIKGHGLRCVARGPKVVVEKAATDEPVDPISSLYEETTLSSLVGELPLYDFSDTAPPQRRDGRRQEVAPGQQGVDQK